MQTYADSLQDLIKAETPHLGPRIQLMLSQLEFKLSVERQYKDGIEKMVRLYQIEGDRKSKADAEGRRIESNQKIQLLKQALKRHEDLHVDIGGEIQDGKDCTPATHKWLSNRFADDSLNMPSQRKPLSGHLSIRILAVADVDHAATGRFSRGPETFVIMKVEDSFKGRTKATRTDKWTDEQHEFDIDKANEVELTVYDKAGEHPFPIGMLWIRISDIAEEMRRKRIETEFNNSGWISADKMGEGGAAHRPDLQFSPPPGSQSAAPLNNNLGGPPVPQGDGPVPQTAPMVIDDWFSLEPVGKIRLAMSFGKQRFALSLAVVSDNCSETNQGPQTIRCRFEPKGSHSTAERRSGRAIWTQIRAADLLQYHALRTVRRFPQVLCWNAVCGLQIYLPQEVLCQSRYQVYQQIQRGIGPGRGEDQPPDTSSVRGLFEYGRKLVLSLWVYSALGEEAMSEMHR